MFVSSIVGCDCIHIHFATRIFTNLHPLDAILKGARGRRAFSAGWKERRAREDPATARAKPSREIIYWSIKMTHGGIRWHVSVHDWPLILIPVSIGSSTFPPFLPFILFPPLSFSLSPCLSSANADGERVSIGIGYRTTNAPFTDDNHPRRSPGSLDLSHGRHELLSSS